MIVRITLTQETAKEMDRLENTAKRLGDYRLLRRIGAIRAYLAGTAIAQIAQTLCLAEQTVRNWCHQFLAKVVKSLQFGRSSGRPSRLTKTQKRILCQIIERGPLEAGFNSGCWTSMMVQQVIAKQFNVNYNYFYVSQLLKQLGFSYQKAKFVSDHLNEEAREKWLNETWPQIYKEAKAKGIPILFGDEATCAMWGSLGRTWSRKGEQPLVKTSGKRKGYKIFGLLDYFSGQLYTQAIRGKFNSKTYIEFLEQVLERTTGNLIVIQDGARYHTSKECRAFFDNYKKRLTVHQLPSYSPDFNPIEHFWKKLKERATHNQYFETFEELVEKVDHALVHFASMPSELVSLMKRYCNMGVSV